MRKRIYNWHGERFVYLWLEGEAGEPAERQSQRLFERAGAELAALGLALDRNVVRTRVYGRTREARDIVSAARGRAFAGQARAATSSFISPAHFDTAADVALDLYAMAEPKAGAPRKVTEMEPVQPFIRHLVWGPFVFHAGMTNEHFPTLKEQCAEILPRAGARLKENGCDWSNVVRISFMLHASQTSQSVLDIASAIAPVPLDHAEIELVEGYSRPGKLVEIEVTARR
jgi:enamine deaminase RidA (YjgF/YER057c/UK114 family)